MPLATVLTRGKLGIEAPLVSVEVDIANGLPGLSIVGLPEAAVRESKDRVRAAIVNSHLEFPARKITINLAPADFPKEGGRFDLAIALGILAASGQIHKEKLSSLECLGELSLSGELRPVSGILPAALSVMESGRTLVLPQDNLAEAMLVDGIDLIPARSILELCACLNQDKPLLLDRSDLLVTVSPSPGYPDFSEVKGQYQAKRALEVAATGGHNLIMLGPPGTGKSMLASRLPGILPALNQADAIQTAAVASVSDVGFDTALWRIPPFRSPHHTATAASLVGGGSQPRPGEISLAHHGVLFLDELPEFDRKVLEVLREPLENGQITIARAAGRAVFPARFQLLAAMNPCPCGYLGDSGGRCHCTEDQVKRYRAKISGPLLDRIDIHIEVPRMGYQELQETETTPEESSDKIRQRVETARQVALQRQNKLNAIMTPADIEKYCVLPADAEKLLAQAMTQLRLSHRAYHRILKLARTIADLAASENITAMHLSEAIAYRRLDRCS